MTEQDKIELDRLAEEKNRLDMEQNKLHEAYNNKYKEYQIAKSNYEKFFYKDKTCDSCRYDAVTTFSFDGWHNLCGHSDAPCTCCHRHCEYYKPDNVITKWIKERCGYTLDPKHAEAIELLYTDIMEINDTDLSTCSNVQRAMYEKIIETLRIKCGEKESRSNK